MSETDVADTPDSREIPEAAETPGPPERPTAPGTGETEENTTPQPGGDDPVARASYRLFSLLTEGGYLPDVDLLAVRDEAPGRFLGDLLVERGLMQEAELQAALVRVLHIPWVPADRIHLPEDLVALLPEAFCQEHRLMPIARAKDFLTVAMVNPLDAGAAEQVHQLSGLRVKAVLCSQEDLDLLIRRAFSADASAEAESKEEADMSAALSEAAEALAAAGEGEGAEQDPGETPAAPIVVEPS